MQRMEAQRVMQASAYVIGGALRDIDRGDTTRGNQLLQQMSQVLNGQATAVELGGSIQQAALEVSKHPVLKQEAPLVLHAVALAQSVQQLVKLEQLAPGLTLIPEQQPGVKQRRGRGFKLSCWSSTLPG
jgi:hypothetical protein